MPKFFAVGVTLGYGRLELVELLLSRGADFDATNNKKQKAIDVAKLNGEVRLLQYWSCMMHAQWLQAQHLALWSYERSFKISSGLAS